MKQGKGYAGPITHYWGDSVNYIGPASDWRYEGLCLGFLGLYKRTSEKAYLERAIECSEFIMQSQLSNGAFLECGFEANPCFGHTYQPHLAASLIGLLSVANALAEEGMDNSRQLAASKKCATFILKNYFDERLGCFVQYENPRAKKVPNPIVPNKICTICEAMFLWAEISGDKVAEEKALSSMAQVLKFQETKKGRFFGGIYQSNLREKMIVYYTARCVGALKITHEKTGERQYLSAAQNAVLFAKRHFTKNGFEFGYSFKGDKISKHVYPIFGAGAADILRAILLVEKKIPAKQMDWFLGMSNGNGAFRNFIGLSHKDTTYAGKAIDTWKDFLPSVGWNDKALRLLAQLPPLPSGNHLFSDSCEKDFGDVHYFEDKEKITVSGSQNRVFGKRALFCAPFSGLKELVYASTSNFPLAPMRLLGSRMLRKLGELR
ncbi:MAG: hypothetical protein NUV67_03245 [archaeon]|nr:hypothetical protein [archaeon]